MARVAQVYNPVHGQRLKRGRLNVMGRVLDKKIQSVGVYLDRALIRRVRVAGSGAFECRMDLSRLNIGKHEVEVRVITGHRTERLVVPVHVVETTPDEASEGSEFEADPDAST